MSQQFGLWKGDRCRALVKGLGRHWCALTQNPKSVSVEAARFTREQLLSAIGAGHGCDHRASWTVQGLIDLIADTSITQDLGMVGKADSYPRGGAYHTRDGKVFAFLVEFEGAEPRVGEIVNGHVIAPVPMPEWLARYPLSAPPAEPVATPG